MTYTRKSLIRLLKYALWMAAILACTGLPIAAQNVRTSTHSALNRPISNVLLIIDNKVVRTETVEIVRGPHAMIWIRELEKLGLGKVQTGKPGNVTISSGNVSVTFTSDRGVALVNSLAVKLPVNTFERDGKLMVPLSFVARAFGAKYEYSMQPVALLETSGGSFSAVLQGRNALQGKALYNGKGAPGLKVCVVNKDYDKIDGTSAITNANGEYIIQGLPDGEYRAYIYIGDNPGFFNRESALLTVNDGQTANVEPMVLGRVINPLKPAVGGIAHVNNGRIKLEWSACDGAKAYKLAIHKPGVEQAIHEIASDKTTAFVEAADLGPGTYEARVTAINTGGDFLGSTPGAGKPPWLFTIVER